MDKPQVFWDAFRRRWRGKLVNWTSSASGLTSGARTARWTEEIKLAAEEACQDFARQIGREARVERERHHRLDVYAKDVRTNELIVAFESELAYWNYNGASGKDWRQEFPKLCGIGAELRVLSSTFKPGTGSNFRSFLGDRLNSMKASFDSGEPGDFCLIFGPEDTRRDPAQCWLAFALERDFQLRELSSTRPLRPRFVIEGKESCTEGSS